VLNGL